MDNVEIILSQELRDEVQTFVDMKGISILVEPLRDNAWLSDFASFVVISYLNELNMNMQKPKQLAHIKSPSIMGKDSCRKYGSNFLL